MRQGILPEYTKPITDADVLSCFKGHQDVLTRKQIADRLSRKKTPDLIRRITRLVDEGHLMSGLTRLPNGVDMYTYWRAYDADAPL